LNEEPLGTTNASRAAFKYRQESIDRDTIAPRHRDGFRAIPRLCIPRHPRLAVPVHSVCSVVKLITN